MLSFSPTPPSWPTYDFAELCRLPVTPVPSWDGECVVVSGLPRSGTSMMMRVLAAGGFPLLVDKVRPADENNRLGYYEFAPVKASPRDVTWFEQGKGKAVKVVAPLLRYLPAERPLRLIVMHRPLSQVMASQQAMLQSLGNGPSFEQEATTEHFVRLMKTLPTWLEKNAQWSVLHVAFEAMLANPGAECHRLALFLGRNFDSLRAATAVDPSQKRFGRREIGPTPSDNLPGGSESEKTAS